MTLVIPNGSRGARPIVSTIVEQLGFVTICPRQPRLRLWCGSNFRCSGLISGTSKGTSGSMRWFLELETTTWPASANARSISVATEASSAEKIRCGALPGLHPPTVNSPTDPGITPSSRQPFHLEPGMTLQESNEMLAHHSGGAQDSDFNFSGHCSFLGSRKQLPHHLPVNLHGLAKLPLRHSFFQRVSLFDAARSDQKRFSPAIPENRNVGCVGNDCCRKAVEGAQTHRWGMEDFLHLRATRSGSGHR